MTVQYKNRVRGTATTTGTGTYTVAAAPTGFQSFSALTTGRQVYYCAVLGASWEVGLGTVTVGGTTTLTRDVILESSSAGSAINWPAGTKDIFLVNPAEVINAVTYEGAKRILNINGNATIQEGVNAAGTIGGTADAVTAVLAPAISAYGDKIAVLFTPAADNTGAATLALNGLTARPVVREQAIALSAADLKTGIPAHVVYDLANTRWILLNPQAATPLALGGTGATTAAGARTALGVTATGADTAYAFRANNLSDLASAATARTNLGLGTAAVQAIAFFLQAANNLSDLANAATSRTNLGLGSAALLAAAAVLQTANNLSDLASAATARANLGLGGLAILSTINGGNWAGTDLAVVDGGTGASDAATARTNLGLGSIATQAIATFLQAANNLSDLANAGTARTNLGLGSIATQAIATFLQAANNLSDIASAATARGNLGLGALATLGSINGGNWSGTDLAVADGGTGSSTAAGARTNLGLGSISTANVTAQSGGSASGGADGDIYLIY